MNELQNLFEKLREKNEAIRRYLIRELQSSEEDMPHQHIHPPSESLATHLATLTDGVYRPISPMLRCLYSYTSCWERAIVGQMILSPTQMTKLWNNSLWMEAIQTRADNWSNSPPAEHDWGQLSLFAIDYEAQEETYLIWREGNEEPSVVSYQAGLAERFSNVKELFEAYVNAPL